MKKLLVAPIVFQLKLLPKKKYLCKNFKALITQDFVFQGNDVELSKGSATWRAPSNIALVKYWGKTDPQIPKNPSLSLTLDACYTQTKLTYTPKDFLKKFQFEVFLDNEKKDDFKPKIQSFFERIEVYVPFLKEYFFKIQTHNSFPHSSGIASSASGLAALALCVMSIEKELNPNMKMDYFYQKASFLARLGSGSAARSVKGSHVVWGKHKEIPESSDLFGVPFSHKIHPIFTNFHNTILLVDKGQKQVSSSLGHELMINHPFATERFKQASENITRLSEILQNGDIDSFISIVESEALTLHAMMLTSKPYFILMKPNTLEIIHKIWTYRKETGNHICFTLDAGANVHVLYPENEKDSIHPFIVKELIPYCENNQYICDRIGNGAKQI